MSPMRIFIIVVILIVVLFVVGFGGGLSRDSSSSTPSLANLKDSPLTLIQGIVPPSPLAVADLEPSDCLQTTSPQPGIVLAPGQANCTLTIRSSFLPVRKQITATLAAGSAAVLGLQPKVGGKDGMTVLVTLNAAHRTTTPDEMQKLEVYKDGGTLTVSCNGGCRIVIGRP